MSRAIEFACPCGVSFGVPPILAGNVGRCPVCARTLSVPVPAPQPEVKSLERTEAPFQLVRVDCACGREIPAPRARLRAGEARCPSCDRVLEA